MRKEILPIAALGFLLLATPLHADELAMPEGDAAAPAMALPSKGMTKSKVEAQFGAPANKRAPVGGDSPRHPPITRWDYPGFSVFFENDHVVDAVVPGAPAKIVNRKGLEPAAPSEAPPPPDLPVAPVEPLEPPAAAPVDVPTSTPSATYQTAPEGEDPGLVEDREKALQERGMSEDAAPVEMQPDEGTADAMPEESEAPVDEEVEAAMPDDTDEPPPANVYDEPQPLE